MGTAYPKKKQRYGKSEMSVVVSHKTFCLDLKIVLFLSPLAFLYKSLQGKQG